MAKCLVSLPSAMTCLSSEAPPPPAAADTSFIDIVHAARSPRELARPCHAYITCRTCIRQHPSASACITRDSTCCT
jgi:hypothetical protein